MNVGAGTEETAFGSARFGGTAADGFDLRGYGKYLERDSGLLEDGEEAFDDWEAYRTGFRADWDATSSDHVTVQGEIYTGEEGIEFTAPVETPPFEELRADRTDFSGGHVLVRYSHSFGPDSDGTLQLYYDRINRGDVLLEQGRDTIDVELNHRWKIAGWNELVWGGGYRLIRDELTGFPPLTFTDERRDFHLVNGFVQDEIALFGDQLRIVAGTKIEYFSMTDEVEPMPTVRAIWTPGERHAVWAAFSRAIRNPARIDHFAILDALVVPIPFLPVVAQLQGDRDYESEKLLAYEVGYRVRPIDEISVDVSAFYNEYEDLFTLEPGLPVLDDSRGTRIAILPLGFDNGRNAESWGVEIVADIRPLDWWRFEVVWTNLRLEYSLDSTSLDFLAGIDQSVREDPRNQVSLRSFLDLPHDLELDSIARWVDAIPGHQIEPYWELDLRLAWNPLDELTVAVVGRNLVSPTHIEYVSDFILLPRTETERSVYAELIWDWDGDWTTY